MSDKENRGSSTMKGVIAIGVLAGVVLAAVLGCNKGAADALSKAAKHLDGARPDHALRAGGRESLAIDELLRKEPDWKRLVSPDRPTGLSSPAESSQDAVTNATPPTSDADLGLKNIDVTGLLRDARDYATERRNDGDSEDKPLSNKWTVFLVTHASRSEYHGPEGAELDLAKIYTDQSVSLSRNGQEPRTYRGVETSLPEKSKGEVDRCRLRFGDDGRVFLSWHHAMTTGREQTVTCRGTYELEFIHGTRADYESGKQVTLRFTAEGLKRQQQDVCRYFEEVISSSLSPEASRHADVIPQKEHYHTSCTAISFAQTLISATRSSVAMQDVGVTALRIAAIDETMSKDK